MQQIQFTGLDDIKNIERELDRAAASATATARPVVRKALLNIKNDARRRVTGLAHAPAYPHAITFDSQDTPTGAKGEVGPDKVKRQGALGNILEFGTVNNAPIPHMAPAAEREEPRFVKAMEDAVVKALGW